MKKQESLDDLREVIEAVVKEPLEKIAASVDRAVKLVIEARKQDKLRAIETQKEHE